ncbi:ABC transporter substrate-binding protein [Acholeplasma granularum]|uniref:ABC transporter substrate-binding protein n=1 Tax=Acholeplasma granularum TaxID=264635 RepID=UPI00046F5F04|nr:extracellular solute-binding protein [Acholeplasma granularum]
MKKIFIILTSVLFLFVLVACGPGTNEPDPNPDPDPNPNPDPDPDETKYDLGGIDFVIMVDNGQRSDPRSSIYERLFKEEKAALISKVEEKYNIKVVFQTYPTNASWGGARERYIIEESALKTQSAHVYEIISTSLGNLAEQDAIVPLDDYIDAYGSKNFWESKKAFGLVKGSYYGYDDQFPIADKGLYYNVDLMGRVLGTTRKNEPLELWKKGEWTWEKFAELANTLKSGLNHLRSDEDGGPQYVFGGRTYNWAYGFIGANGGQLVDDEFNTYLTSKPVLDALEYLNGLYQVPGMWIDDASLSNTSQPQFSAGNVVFQDGESWHITASNKWGNANFPINFIPYPVGPNINEDKSNYRSLYVGGKSTHVISSSFAKANIPPGYEDLMIHDEIIFKIWADMQYFPETLEEVQDDFYNTRLRSSYESADSREIHLELIDNTYPDNFYSVAESLNQVEGSFMLMIQQSIRSGDVRNVMTSTESSLRAILIERFKLGEGFYN